MGKHQESAMEIKVKLRPFTVPNFVLAETSTRPRAEEFGEPPSFPLADVDAEALEALCVQFRADIFKKAGKTDPDHARPRQAPCTCGGVK